MRAALALLVVLAALLAPGRGASPRPRYIACVDSSECGTWECCMVGMGRFSLPRCAPMADLGDACRPGQQGPDNVTLSYPDGSVVQLPAVHRGTCPCTPGHYCDAHQAVCAARDAGAVDQDDLNAV